MQPELQMTFCLAGAWMFKNAWLAQKAVLLHSQENIITALVAALNHG
jgi:predicted Rdx family selenoprotein